MRAEQGHSFLQDARGAIAEATHGWSSTPEPEVVFAFVSTAQDSAAVATELRARFPKSIVVGCTTTGEHAAGQHLRRSLVLAALFETGMQWAVAVARDLTVFGAEQAEAVARSLFSDLAVDENDFDPADYFCLSFMDGLRMKEEGVTALVADALQGVHLVGGSAGDDLAFKETRVLANGESLTDTAVFVMGRGKNTFRIMKHQHFTTTARQVVITKVDVAARRVYEMDGLPALEGYANALGLSPEQVTSDVTFLHPVTFSCDGQIFVRSIQRIEPDGSIVFYCGVEEGMVLEIGDHHDMVESLGQDLQRMIANTGPFDFFLGYNCILRALEADKTSQSADVAALWQTVAKASVGFDTYGEQIDGVHINQTLVGIGFRGTEAA
jgi:hypothetical protein